MGYAVKNVKSFQGREGIGYECSLYRDGKRVATVVNTANGGETDFYWKDMDKSRVEVAVHDWKDEMRTILVTPEEKLLHEHTDHMFYDESFGDKPLRMGIDGYIDTLADTFEQNKTFKKWCRKQTCFRLKGDAKDSWRTINMKFSDPRVKPHLVNKHGEQLEEILNERFA